MCSCPHFPACSGCSAIGKPYQAQLDAKRTAVQRVFAEATPTPFASERIREIVASPLPTGYRNRARLVPAWGRDAAEPRRVQLGLYQVGSHSVVDIPGCPVQSDGINRVIECIRDGIERFGISLYDERTDEGDLRFVTVREGVRTAQLLVGLVTRTEAFASGDQLARHIRAMCADVVGVVQNINTQQGNVILGRETRVMCGEQHVEEIIRGQRLRFDIASFFQVNTPVAELAYEAIEAQLELDASCVLLDLYCGVGAIGLCAGKRASRVVGIEVSPPAIAMAQACARVNERRNIDFHRGTVEQELPKLVTSMRKAGIDPEKLRVVVNPPRKGLEPKTISALVQTHPARMAYLSCEPPTLVRDLILLCDGGYKVVNVTLFDMFPQTDKIETLAILEWDDCRAYETLRRRGAARK